MMKARRVQLLAEVNRTGRLDILSAAAFFGVTAMTIRRDFRFLEEHGYLLQVKGAAVPRPRLYGEGVSALAAVKHHLAVEFLKIVPAGSSILLSSGTTTLACAQHLAASGVALTVVTYSLPIASALFQSRCRVLLTGGEMRSNAPDLIGPLAEKNISGYHVDYLVTGCDGADSEVGFYTSDLNLASMEKASVGIAEKVIVVTESVKFKRKSLVEFMPVAAANVVITDRHLHELDRLLLLRSGVEVREVGG